MAKININIEKHFVVAPYMVDKEEQHSKHRAQVAGSLFIYTDKKKDLNGLSNIRINAVLEGALDFWTWYIFDMVTLESKVWIIYSMFLYLEN